jgi:hypothetical protein
MRLGCGRMKLNGLESTSGSLRCSSSAGLGSEAVRVADDGGQWWRRRSDEGVSSGKRECGGKEVRQRVNKITE